MFNTQKIFIIGGVAVILIFFVYSLFMKEDLGSDAMMPTESSVAGENILSMVETLKKISIDKSLFTSDLFLGLRDFTVNLTEEQQGRPNPFAQIGNDGNFNPTPQNKKPVQP